MSSLMLHSGAKRIALEKLDLFPAPPPTETYGPVSHIKLVETIHTSIEKHGLSVTGTELAIQKGKVNDKMCKGARLFGIVKTQISEPDEGDGLSLVFGFRNSYDKSLAVGFVAGSSVFVCDNLALTGEIAVIRKHTPTVWQDINPMIESVAIVATGQHQLDKEMRSEMKDKPINYHDGLDLIGIMAAHGKMDIAGGCNSQFGRAMAEWRTPTHDTFKDRNYWSLYNACTHAVKRASLARIMTDNAGVTLYFKENFFPAINEESKKIVSSMNQIRTELVEAR